MDERWKKEIINEKINDTWNKTELCKLEKKLSRKTKQNSLENIRLRIIKSFRNYFLDCSYKFSVVFSNF